MKALITKAQFVKEFESKFGLLYSFKIEYDGKTAWYSSKKKEQTNFIEGKEAEFTEEVKLGKDNKDYITIKPALAFQGQSNFGKALKKEQARYSAFAVSYCKDLIIADKLKFDQWEAASRKVFKLMVELDKSIES